MKVWVCRDDDGYYEFFKEEAVPYLSGVEGQRQWYDDEGRETFLFDLSAELFKELTGLDHIRKGRKKLMVWYSPLV